MRTDSEMRRLERREFLKDIGIGIIEALAVFILMYLAFFLTACSAEQPRTVPVDTVVVPDNTMTDSTVTDEVMTDDIAVDNITTDDILTDETTDDDSLLSDDTVDNAVPDEVKQDDAQMDDADMPAVDDSVVPVDEDATPTDDEIPDEDTVDEDPDIDYYQDYVWSESGETFMDMKNMIRWYVGAFKRGETVSVADLHNACYKKTWDGITGWGPPDINSLRMLIRGCPGTETGGACQVVGSTYYHQRIPEDCECRAISTSPGYITIPTTPEQFDKPLWSGSGVNYAEPHTQSQWAVIPNTGSIEAVSRLDAEYEPILGTYMCVVLY